MSYNINWSLEMDVTVDVGQAHWTNDGIGHYEYWGQKCYDKGHDYVEEVDIDKFTLNINGKKIEIDPEKQKEVFQFFYELIADDEGFINLVEEHEKELGESAKLEAQLDRLEDKKYYDQINT